MTCDKFFGQYFRQLLRVANSLRSVAARLNAVAGASAIALVFLAQLFVAAILIRNYTYLLYIYLQSINKTVFVIPSNIL
jgi:hypothetical protein